MLRIYHEFLENCCKNHGECDKVYDSWIRSAVRSAKSKGFGGLSPWKLKEKYPDLYSEITSALSTYSAY